MHPFRVILTTILYFIFCLSCRNANARPDTVPGLIRQPGSIHFLVMGDWGTRGSAPQLKVASAMEAAASQLGISFLIATGDNFYPSGVSSTEDAHWKESFENVYDHPSLQCRWLPVLGNHDYDQHVDAQVNYTRHSNRWFMPGRYYDSSFALGNDSVLLVFLDTEPIERKLRGLPVDTTKYSADYVDTQLKWFEARLKNSSARWKIVTGHHPLHTGGSRRHNRRIKKLRRLLQPVLHASDVSFYFSGHEHHLELLKPKGPTHFIISGAGVEARHVGWLKRYRWFAARKRGFVAVSISPTTALIQFISEDQKVLHRQYIKRNEP